MEAGQFFGEGFLNGHSVWVATTVTLQECVITSITKVATPVTFGRKRRSEEQPGQISIARSLRTIESERQDKKE